MTCRNLFDPAGDKRKKLDCPSRVFPKCHPRAYLDVFCDSKNKTIILVCGQCDRTVSVIKAKVNPDGNTIG